MNTHTSEFSMSKFAVGQMVNNAADSSHESGMVVAVFPTVDDSFRIRCRYGRLRFAPVLRRRKASPKPRRAGPRPIICIAINPRGPRE